MSGNCHNEDRINWYLLAASLKFDKIVIPEETSIHYGLKEHTHYKWSIKYKRLKHFCNVMEQTIKDYAATYKKPKIFDLDPVQWSNNDESYMHNYGAQISFGWSLIMNYIYLNLILLNSDRLNGTTLFTNNTWHYSVCLGQTDHRHPEYMANLFHEVSNLLFDKSPNSSMLGNRIKLKPLTLESVTLTHEYLKKVFECLIHIYQNEKFRDKINADCIFSAMSTNMNLMFGADEIFG